MIERCIALFTFRSRFVALLLSAGAMLFHMPLMVAIADDYISPQLVKVTTPRYDPRFEDFTPRMGTYAYVVSWQGIPAASATATFSEKDDTYIVDASARTNSAIDLLYKLRYQAVGTVLQSNLRSKRLFIDHRENSRVKNIDLQFSPFDGFIKAVRTRVGSTERKEVSFFSGNTLDPIGAGFLARSLSWNIGESKSFDVFNGKSRYLITLTAVNRETIDYRGEKRDCFVITPQVRNLTTTKAVEKLREAFIYVTADKYRDVLKIESSVFIGSVLTELDSFVPATQPLPTVQLASSANDDEARASARIQ